MRGLGVQVQADLMDVSSHAKHNDGIRFLLTIVDAFSLFIVGSTSAKQGRQRGGTRLERDSSGTKLRDVAD